MARLIEEKWVRDELAFAGDISGGKSKAARRVQEWVTFHGFTTGIDDDYGPATRKAVRAFQGARGLNATGVVDKETWSVLTRPLRDVMAIINPPPDDLSEAISAYARQHLAAHPVELGPEPNQGPWVRLYMKGRDGEAFLWCAGFATTVVRQACEAIGQPTSVAYTMSCDELGKAARNQDLFLSGKTVLGNAAAAARIRPGSIFLIQNPANAADYMHTGIVIAADSDSFTTIEGNTNQGGSRNGFEVCRRERAYPRADFYLVR